MRAAHKPRRSRAQWQRLMLDYEASSQSQQVFCREHGLALSTFARWRRALAEQRVSVVGGPAGEAQRLFTELTVPVRGWAFDEAPPWEIELALGASMVLRIRRGESCAAAHVHAMLGKQFTGTLLSDGYEAYARYASTRPKVTHAQCWAHTRHYFERALEAELSCCAARAVASGVIHPGQRANG